MDHELQGELDNQEKKGTKDSNSESQLEILSQIESGQINVDDALQRLQATKGPENEMEVLEKLEQGQIDVQEALHLLENSVPTASVDPAVPSEDVPGPAENWRDWWLVFFASALGILAIGGWLATLGGWWWLLGGPTLFLGFVLLVLSLASKNAPWLHLRVDTGQQTWPRRIALSFPIPIKLASWGLRVWGPRIPNLDETAIDDLILAMEGQLSSDTPIYIEVEEDETTGEKVQIFLG